MVASPNALAATTIALAIVDAPIPESDRELPQHHNETHNEVVHE